MCRIIFSVNIRPDQRQALQEFLTSHGFGAPPMYPMVRARITALNSQPAQSLKLRGDAAAGYVEREQNLTWSAAMMEDNQLIAGRWWSAADAGKPWCPISSEYADALHLKVGDRLSFDVAGEPLTVTGGQHPKNPLGQLPAEFLPGVSAGPARRRGRNLHDQHIS